MRKGRRNGGEPRRVALRYTGVAEDRGGDALGGGAPRERGQAAGAGVLVGGVEGAAAPGGLGGDEPGALEAVHMVDDGAPAHFGLLGQFLQAHPGARAHDRKESGSKRMLQDRLAPDAGEEEEEREGREARVKDEQDKDEAQEERGARVHRVQARGPPHKYRDGPGPFVRSGNVPSRTMGSFGKWSKPGIPVRPVSAKATAKMV